MLYLALPGLARPESVKQSVFLFFLAFSHSPPYIRIYISGTHFIHAVYRSRQQNPKTATTTTTTKEYIAKGVV
jgi:hypothetical protein